MKWTLLVLHFFLAISCNSAAKNTPTLAPEVKPNCEFGYCDCPDGYTQIVDGDKNRCIDPNQKNVCLARPEGFKLGLKELDPAVFQSCFVLGGKSPNNPNLQAGRFVIQMHNLSYFEKGVLADWADENRSRFLGLQSWPTASDIGLGETLKVEKILSDESFSSVLNPFPMPLRLVDYIFNPLAPKTFQSLGKLFDYLENPSAKTPLLDDFNFDPRARRLIEFYKSFSFQGAANEEALTDRECGESCVRSFAQNVGEDYIATYREYLVEDQIFRSDITLTRNDLVEAYLYLAGYHISSLFLVDRDATHAPISIRSFAGDGKSRGEKVFEGGLKMLSLRQKYLKKPVDFSTRVGLCEDGLDPKDVRDAGHGDRLLFGPHVNDSFYGWTPSTTTGKMFWQGRFYLNRLDLPYTTDNHRTHAIDTFNTLVGNDDEAEFGIIPLGADACMKTESIAMAWPEVSVDPRLRVINLSASEAMGEAECLERLSQHPIVTHPEVLWVISGGNQPLKKPQGCPQYLSGRSNVIIVGASENGKMHPSSNYGEEYVDIATSGKVENSDAWGTSFAAPRVTRVAAKIFDTYPKMTSAQVRLAILLGTKELSYYNHELPVRSRGELDERRALQYAKAFQKEKNLEEAVVSMECTFGTTFGPCDSAQDKLNLIQHYSWSL